MTTHETSQWRSLRPVIPRGPDITRYRCPGKTSSVKKEHNRRFYAWRIQRPKSVKKLKTKLVRPFWVPEKKFSIKKERSLELRLHKARRIWVKSPNPKRTRHATRLQHKIRYYRALHSIHTCPFPVVQPNWNYVAKPHRVTDLFLKARLSRICGVFHTLNWNVPGGVVEVPTEAIFPNYLERLKRVGVIEAHLTLSKPSILEAMREQNAAYRNAHSHSGKIPAICLPRAPAPSTTEPTPSTSRLTDLPVRLCKPTRELSHKEQGEKKTLQLAQRRKHLGVPYEDYSPIPVITKTHDDKLMIRTMAPGPRNFNAVRPKYRKRPYDPYESQDYEGSF